MTETVKIKICGLTSLEDAYTALNAGADYLGFIFAPQSKRRLSPAAACDIIKSLPHSTITVGVFVNEKTTEIVEIARFCNLKVIQLHGDESNETIDRLSQRMEVWKTVWPAGTEDIEKITDSPADLVLVDSVSGDQRGGTGRTGDWRLAAELAEKRKIILAGGLTAANVIPAIRQVRPCAVDVSSGVEIAPGRKDHAAIRNFCAAVKSL